MAVCSARPRARVDGIPLRLPAAPEPYRVTIRHEDSRVRISQALAVTGVVASMFVVARAQAPGPRPETFPAQQRPPGEPAAIARGKLLYEATCMFCHGADLRGGHSNGPNLLRSDVVLRDQNAELIIPIVHGSRAEAGMPAIAMPDGDVKAVAEYIRSVLALSPRLGMPPPPAEPPALNIVVGDAAAGQAYFAATCRACHSVSGDLQGIASRIPDPKLLQNVWISGVGLAGFGRGGRGAAAQAAQNARAFTVTVTTPRGERWQGRLLRIDDFVVSMVRADGTVHSFRRIGAVPKVEVHDPLERHRTLLAVYTDRDIHNVTAYLVTLK